MDLIQANLLPGRDPVRDIRTLLAGRALSSKGILWGFFFSLKPPPSPARLSVCALCVSPPVLCLLVFSPIHAAEWKDEAGGKKKERKEGGVCVLTVRFLLGGLLDHFGEVAQAATEEKGAEATGAGTRPTTKVAPEKQQQRQSCAFDLLCPL